MRSAAAPPHVVISSLKRQPAAWALGASVIFMLLYCAFGWSGWGPPHARESLPGELSRWCERVSGGLFREPVNALSNLGFMVAGVLMFRVLSRDRPDQQRLNRFHGLTPAGARGPTTSAWSATFWCPG